LVIVSVSAFTIGIISAIGILVKLLISTTLVSADINISKLICSFINDYALKLIFS